MDLLGPNFGFDVDHVLSNWSTVYASTDTLIIAEPAQNWWWFWFNDEIDEASNLHRFDISDAGQTVYTGSGRVDGTILGQFALSEHKDYIRVASTTGRWNRWWSEDPTEPENHIYVLEGETELEVIGHTGGIAVGERIWSSRFVGDKAYLVTFRNIDPLWTIDLKNPTNPVIVGELEVPGVSTYIHPLEDGNLLTIGYGGDDEGLNWKTQISLFDVSDFARPTLASALSLAPTVDSEGWSYAWSEANYEHKAFQYWGPMKMLAVPLSTWRWVNNDEEGESRYHYEYVSKLSLVSVEAGEELEIYGDVDHSDFYNLDDDDEHYYYRNPNIRRSIFMGDYIYAISSKGVTSHKISDMSLVRSLPMGQVH